MSYYKINKINVKNKKVISISGVSNNVYPKRYFKLNTGTFRLGVLLYDFSTGNYQYNGKTNKDLLLLQKLSNKYCKICIEETGYEPYDFVLKMFQLVKKDKEWIYEIKDKNSLLEIGKYQSKESIELCKNIFDNFDSLITKYNKIMNDFENDFEIMRILTNK